MDDVGMLSKCLVRESGKMSDASHAVLHIVMDRANMRSRSCIKFSAEPASTGIIQYLYIYIRSPFYPSLKYFACITFTKLSAIIDFICQHCRLPLVLFHCSLFVCLVYLDWSRPFFEWIRWDSIFLTIQLIVNRRYWTYVNLNIQDFFRSVRFFRWWCSCIETRKHSQYLSTLQIVQYRSAVTFFFLLFWNSLLTYFAK